MVLSCCTGYLLSVPVQEGTAECLFIGMLLLVLRPGEFMDDRIVVAAYLGVLVFGQRH